MIPADDADLPPGSDPAVVQAIRDYVKVAPVREAGTVSLIESNEGGKPRVIGNRPWSGSPVLVVLEFFGLPCTEETYGRLMDSVMDKDGKDLFVRAESDHVEGEAYRAALVQTVAGWTLEDAQAFLNAHKH